jgi:fermentation-respiration switch protein FrsA (DUF1100 family)
MAFQNISPVRTIPKISIPCLFFHGLEDKLTPARMSEALHEAKTRGLRAMYLAPGADHAQAFASDPQAYEAQLADFLAECLAQDWQKRPMK